jgi:hypothetical protein
VDTLTPSSLICGHAQHALASRFDPRSYPAGRTGRWCRSSICTVSIRPVLMRNPPLFYYTIQDGPVYNLVTCVIDHLVYLSCRTAMLLSGRFRCGFSQVIKAILIFVHHHRPSFHCRPQQVKYSSSIVLFEDVCAIRIASQSTIRPPWEERFEGFGSYRTSCRPPENKD